MTECYCCGKSCHKTYDGDRVNVTTACLSCCERFYEIAGFGVDKWKEDYRIFYAKSNFDSVAYYNGSWKAQLELLRQEGRCPQCGEKHGELSQ
jgi:hypothetical protein